MPDRLKAYDEVASLPEPLIDHAYRIRHPQYRRALCRARPRSVHLRLLRDGTYLIRLRARCPLAEAWGQRFFYRSSARLR
jgi:hypothetical protein